MFLLRHQYPRHQENTPANTSATAQKALEKGLQRKPWVKSSLAPGSKVVTDYLNAAGLMPYLNQLGYNLVGYGCTTCIGNSGPLPEAVEEAVQAAEPTEAVSVAPVAVPPVRVSPQQQVVMLPPVPASAVPAFNKVEDMRVKEKLGQMGITPPSAPVRAAPVLKPRDALKSNALMF